MRRPTLVLMTLTLFLATLGATSASAAPPTIDLTTISHVTTTSVMLEAEINPQKKATKYHFEYGPADCASNPCTSTPEPDESIGSGEAAVAVKAQIEGLTPGTSYHFRVIATSKGTGGGETQSVDRAFATYPPEPVFGPCPNDAFRTGSLAPRGHPSANLSDCRAYEQASPVDKNGLDVSGNYPLIKSSPNGEAVSFAATSGMPPGGGTQQPPLYLASRGEGHWSSRGLFPPESYGQIATMLGWTPDFSQVFTSPRRFGHPDTKSLLDLSADGSLTEVVPYDSSIPDFSFVGASADGSRVFIGASRVQLTPEAALGKSNLYLWNRDTGSFTLVGVLPDAECGSPPPCAPPDGSIAGPYNWADGGGAYYLQDEHTISTDGSSAYFTAGGTKQLYRRAGIGSSSPETEHVSASEKTNGSGEDGHDANGARPAAFMAATPDGSKAFFTSSEKLTNDATTGPEPTHPAAIARADLSGLPASVDLDFLPAHAFGIAIQGEYVYWANPSKESIGRSKLNGAEFDEEFIEGAGDAQYVAVDGEYIYWSNTGDEEDEEGTIGRAKIGPSEATDVKQDFITGANNPRGVAVEGEYIYWANAGDPAGNGEAAATRTIGRAKLVSGQAEEIAQAFIQVDEGSQEFRPQGLAVNATHIYTAIDATQAQSYIVRYDLSGDPGSRKPRFDSQHIGQSGVRGIAIDGSSVYWARQGQDTIGRVNLELEGASAEREWIKDAGHPGGLALDGEHLYWSANQEVLPNPGNDLYRYDADKAQGERLTDLAVDHGGENGAEVRGVLGTSSDGSYVYFVANGVPDGVTGSPNAQGETATPGGTCPEILDGTGKGICNLYLAHEGSIGFIARIEDEANWTGTPAGITTSESRFQKTSRVSADGRTLLFSSERQLTTYDNTVFDEEGKPVRGASELYLYRVGDPGLICVSCNPTGAAPSPSATNTIEVPLLFASISAKTLSRSLSTDGNRVFFESTDPLVAADTNGDGGCPTVGTPLQQFSACQDIYEWEAKGSGTCESEAQNGGCLYLISTGKSSSPSFFADASADGDDVLFITRSQLVGQDGDRLLDVYDARVGGGLVGQNEAPPTPCEAEGCKGSASGPPGFQSPSSASFSGPPNPSTRKPKSRCPRGTRKARVKGKSRCLAKKHKRHRRETKSTGRAGR